MPLVGPDVKELEALLLPKLAYAEKGIKIELSLFIVAHCKLLIIIGLH